MERYTLNNTFMKNAFLIVSSNRIHIFCKKKQRKQYIVHTTRGEGLLPLVSFVYTVFFLLSPSRQKLLLKFDDKKLAKISSKVLNALCNPKLLIIF